jgi:hypothetical protein
LRFFRPPDPVIGKPNQGKEERIMNPSVQLTRQVQYLFLALLFASPAVTAKGDTVNGERILGNHWEIATRFEGNVQCAGGHVTGGGKLEVRFERVRIGNDVGFVPKTFQGNDEEFLKSLFPESFSDGVGATGPGRTYKVDRVELEYKHLSDTDNTGIGKLKIFFFGRSGGVNTAQGDIHPGYPFHFRVVYKDVIWRWEGGNVVSFSYERENIELRCPEIRP